MENTTKVIAIFSDTVTDKAIADIKSKHADLVHDFSNEEEFKAGRKVNTEMNKLLKEVDRVGIDAAKQVTETRNHLKDLIEDAYSGTVTPWTIENQRRNDEKKRIEDERKARIAEQEQTLSMIKGASARALYLNHEEIEDILQDVMNVDVDSFDDDMKQEAKAAKEISLSQLNSAFKNAAEKEEARKQAELKEAELADKEDEIAELKAKLAEMQPQKIEAVEVEFVAKELCCDASDYDSREAMEFFFDEESISDLYNDGDDVEYNLEVVLRRVDI